MSLSEEKKAPSQTGEVEAQTALGSSHEIEGMNILGYKPELRRNRSMLTLLFQSLAIAAVSCHQAQDTTLRLANHDLDPVRLRRSVNQCSVWRR